MIEALHKPQIGIDQIPKGTFYAEYTPKQVAAIRRVVELGDKLAKSSPEIAEMYRNLQGYSDIAEEFIPELFKENPIFATRVIGRAVRQLIPREEQKNLTSTIRAKNIERQLGGFGSDQHLEYQSKAAKVRHEKHGVDVEAMLRGRGRTAWLPEEKEWVMNLSNDPKYQHTTGSIAGTPDYVVIADVINELFHNGEQIRYRNSVASLVRYMRRKK